MVYETDTSLIDVCDLNGAPVGFIDFTKEFKYLGFIVHYSPSSEADVDKRIKSATAAFGALKNVFTNRHLDLKLKGRSMPQHSSIRQRGLELARGLAQLNS